ncbi:MAG: Crp/Fnr family transcriptional regulator [Tissierellia bacterium]|nr:Crp/Fnr family transcriptional regulator [Tissierellia bacterium]
MAEKCNRCGLCMDRVELFEDFTPQEQEKIMEGASHSYLDRGEILFSPEDPVDRIFIIREGKVKLSGYDEEGKEYIYDLRSQNESIGEEYLFSQQKFGSYGICLEKSHICTLTLELLKKNLTQEDLAFKVIGSLGRKLREEREKLEILTIPDAKKRVEQFLYFRSRRMGGGEVTLSTDMIATSVGLRRETVSRKLQELEEEGTILRKGYKKILIKKVEKLRKS